VQKDLNRLLKRSEENRGALFNHEIFKVDQMGELTGLHIDRWIDIEEEIVPAAIAFLRILGDFTGGK
jgi:hypothetical protein